MFEEIKNWIAAALGGSSTRGRIAPMALALITVTAQSGAAQADPHDRARTSVSVSATLTRPVGALNANIGSGYGAFGALLWPVDRRGIVSLRADLGISQYGHEAKRTPFSETVGGRVEVDVRTSNYLVPGSVGVQLTPAVGPLEPYVNIGVGAEAFFTESTVEPLLGAGVVAGTTNQWDIAVAWTVGGGVYVPFGSWLPNVALDFGVQYYRGARAEYLAPGSLADLQGGRIAITPMASSTHLLALRAGARIGL